MASSVLPILADGQLPTALTAIYSNGPRDRSVTLTLCNTSGSLTETITLKTVPSTSNGGSGTARQLVQVVLQPHESAQVRNVQLGPSDVLKAQTTDATTVDYLVMLGDGSGQFAVASMDANGALKQVNTNSAFPGAFTVNVSSVSALVVGPNGATNPTFKVSTNTASAATGLQVTSAAAAAGVALSVISSGANESATLDAKGTGTLTLNGVGGTGPVQIGGAASGANATGLKVTPNAAASGLAVAVVSTSSAENLTIDAKGTGTIGIGTVSTGAITLGAATTVSGNLTLSTHNLVTDASTGSQIATASTQKLGFYGATPVVQPAANTNTTTSAAGSTTAVYLNTTFTGGGTAAYTIGGAIAALKALGLLAA